MKVKTRKILEHSNKSVLMGLTFNMPVPFPIPRNVLMISPAETAFLRARPKCRWLKQTRSEQSEKVTHAFLP